MLTDGLPSEIPPFFHTPFPLLSPLHFRFGLLFSFLFFQEALRTPRCVLFGGSFSNLWETYQEFAFPQIVGCLSSQCSCSSFHQHEIQNTAKLDLFFDLICQVYLCCQLTQKISVTPAALPFQSASLKLRWMYHANLMFQLPFCRNETHTII